MTKPCSASLILIVSLVFLGTTAQAQSGINATGNWTVSATGEPLASGRVRLEQVGSTILGSYGQDGRIDGKFEPGSLQVDANWNDSRGSGWMTIVFNANGNAFSGEWGRPGTKPVGRFVGARSVYPPVTGFYYLSPKGGPQLTTHRLNLHQLGQSVVGNFGAGTELDGTMASDSNSLTGMWKRSGGTGWFKLQFADDSRSFQGTWGLPTDTVPQGQIVGSLVDRSQLWVRGPWQIASSGEAIAASNLKFEQEGQTVSGVYKGGHLEGTLARGSLELIGRWRDSRGTGDLVFKFAADGNSFQGKWTIKGKSSGSIVGKRVIAASPELRP